MSDWVFKSECTVLPNRTIQFNTNTLNTWAFLKKPAEKTLVSIAFEKSHYDFDAGYLVKDTDFIVNALYSDSTTEQVQTSCEYYVNGEKKDFKTGWAINTNGTLKAIYLNKEATTEIQNWI